MKKWRWRWVLLVGALLLGAWIALNSSVVSVGYEPPEPPSNEPVAGVVKDEQPAFRLDPVKPWRIELGRGRLWPGFNTIKLDQDGRAIFHRHLEIRRGSTSVMWTRVVDLLTATPNMQDQGSTSILWVTATAQLPPDAVAKALEAVEANQLLGLDKEYHVRVNDGRTLWVLWIRQGDREKVVYCSNHIPEPMLRFAEQLDAIVVNSVGSRLKWRRVPSGHSGDHDMELWDSIRR